ncbi:hypothetical protein RZN22_09255 [Bacillaceae bacterium S4-13-58]
MFKWFFQLLFSIVIVGVGFLVISLGSGGSTKELEGILQNDFSIELPDDVKNVQTQPEPSSDQEIDTPLSDDTKKFFLRKRQMDEESLVLGDNSSITEENSSLDEIKMAYAPALESLKTQAEQKLDQLFQKGLEEYRTKKENGESISYLQLLSKYQSAALDLEKNTDSTFQKIYEDLVQKLEENGYDKKDAEDIQQFYEEYKKDLESSMMKKVEEMF